MENILKPKRPNKNSGWQLVGETKDQFGYDKYFYTHPNGFVAISALEVADGIIRNEAIPQYHVSISKHPAIRCSSQDAKFILKQFGMSDALEDNHSPSRIIRSFWLPVDENKIGIDCHCVENEPAVILDKGDYIWRPAGK